MEVYRKEAFNKKVRPIKQKPPSAAECQQHSFGNGRREAQSALRAQGIWLSKQPRFSAGVRYAGSLFLAGDYQNHQKKMKM